MRNVLSLVIGVGIALGLAMMSVGIVGKHYEAKAAAQPAPTPDGTWGTAPVLQPTEPTVAPELKPMKFKRNTLREYRRLGATRRNIRVIIAQGQANGEVTPDMSVAAVTVYVATKLVEENPQGFQDPEFDFDAFLDFIERLIPLLMLLIELFSDTLVPEPLVLEDLQHDPTFLALPVKEWQGGTLYHEVRGQFIMRLAV